MPAWSWRGKTAANLLYYASCRSPVWKHGHSPRPLSHPWLMLLILLSLISVCVPLTIDLSCFLMFDHFLSLLFSLLLLLPSALTHRHTNTHIHCVHSQALKYFLSDTHSSASLHIFSLPFFFTHSWCWHAGFSTRTPFSYAHAPVVGRQKEQGREKVVKKQSASSQRERVRAGERGTK